MDLRHDVATLLRANTGIPLADYLAACLNAFEPNSWQRAVAIRARWGSYERQPKAGRDAAVS